jgi:hypothetical protein
VADTANPAICQRWCQTQPLPLGPSGDNLATSLGAEGRGGYIVDLAAPSSDRLPSVFVSDQSTRVACNSQNGAYARPFVSHGSITRKYSTKGLICSALSGLRAISMSKDSMLMLT